MEEIEETEKTVVKESSKRTSSPDGSEKVHQVAHRTFKSVISSRKLWMALFAMILLYLAYWRQVNYLYTFGTYPTEIAPTMITAYTSITRDFMFVFASVIGFYLGIQGAVQWKHGTESLINQATSYISEKKEEKKEETINHNYKEVIIHEGEAGAPELKPFGQHAIEGEADYDK